ncbi:molybdopterin synthase catalytic subunit MoaE [Aliiglaciecola litoralis]|uniref:Molybdopterin synthase catalytic subunit n=1 Tax=Aliiglaciecola litoralis TaxID=582857 RepID=A0ABN1LCC2_9ALTE
MSEQTNKSSKINISVQVADFDQQYEYQALRQNHCSQGAIVTFVGLVRDNHLGKDVTGLFLEHFPGMTEKSLAEIARQAMARWPLGGVRIVHRIGQLALNDQIVFVGVSAAHRHAAFQGCEFIMDYLKTQAPFWKKEYSGDSATWVQAKDSDTQARQRWESKATIPQSELPE